MPSRLKKCTTSEPPSMPLILQCAMSNSSSLLRRPLLRPALMSSARPAMSVLPSRNSRLRFLDQDLLSAGLGSLRRRCAPQVQGGVQVEQLPVICFIPPENLSTDSEPQNDSYAGFDPGTCVCCFLGGIDQPSLETTVHICESQDQYSILFQNCALYLTTMVQQTPASK